MTWVITTTSQFYLHEEESLLDGLLRTGHKLDYQCKEGYCGSCRVKVTAQSNPISYPTAPLAMVEEQEVLSCCCQVEGIIHLDI